MNASSCVSHIRSEIKLNPLNLPNVKIVELNVTWLVIIQQDLCKHTTSLHCSTSKMYTQCKGGCLIS